MNLILAVLWFVAAGVLFYLHRIAELPALAEKEMLPVFALVLGVYNLFRWWSSRVLRKQNELLERTMPRRRLRRASDDMPAPDPNFAFTDAPPPPLPRGSEPPGTNGSPQESK